MTTAPDLWDDVEWQQRPEDEDLHAQSIVLAQTMIEDVTTVRWQELTEDQRQSLTTWCREFLVSDIPALQPDIEGIVEPGVYTDGAEFFNRNSLYPVPTNPGA